MAENTKNLNLKKPAQNDFYNVDDFNENFQKLDEFAGRKDNPHGVTAKQIGAVPVLNGLPSGTDLNSVTTSGFYRINENPINAPSGSAYGQMVVVHGGNDTIAQMIFPYNSLKMYFRSGNPAEIGGSNGWKEWVEVYTSNSGNFAKIQTGSYVGTGSVGGSTIPQMILSFDFTPRIVMVSALGNTSGTYTDAYLNGIFVYGTPFGMVYQLQKGMVGAIDYPISLGWDEDTIFWNSTRSNWHNLSVAGITYTWVAIG